MVIKMPVGAKYLAPNTSNPHGGKRANVLNDQFLGKIISRHAMLFISPIISIMAKWPEWKLRSSTRVSRYEESSPFMGSNLLPKSFTENRLRFFLTCVLMTQFFSSQKSKWLTIPTIPKVFLHDAICFFGINW